MERGMKKTFETNILKRPAFQGWSVLSKVLWSLRKRQCLLPSHPQPTRTRGWPLQARLPAPPFPSGLLSPDTCILLHTWEKKQLRGKQKRVDWVRVLSAAPTPFWGWAEPSSSDLFANDYADRQGLNENFTLNVEIRSFYTSRAEPKLKVCDKLQLLKFLM